MKKSPVVLAVLLAACTKNYDVNFTQSEKQQSKPETCTFGITQFNLTKRATVTNITAKGKPGSGTGSVPASSPIIYLGFDGQLISSTSWNVSGDINCAPVNLTTDQINNIVNRVTEDYRPFNVAVTTGEAAYFTAPATKRMQVIVTETWAETWECYGQSGGTSHIGSFT